MRKLHIFLVALVGNVLINISSALVNREAALRYVIPWGLLYLGLHVAYLVLSSRSVKKVMVGIAKKGWLRMWSYGAVFLICGLLGLAFWWTINRLTMRLTRLVPATNPTTETAPMQALVPPRVDKELPVSTRIGKEPAPTVEPSLVTSIPPAKEQPETKVARAVYPHQNAGVKDEVRANVEGYLVAKLTQEYLLSHDGLTAGEIAGTDITQREADWINDKLKARGDTRRLHPTVLPPSPEESIQSLTVEARMTCIINPGITLPATTQDIIAGFGTGHLTGSAGNVELSRYKQVEFRKQEGDVMTVVNRFYMGNGEALQGLPISRLLNYDKMVIPITVLGSGDLFKTITLFEVTVTINGKHTWYYPWKYNGPFDKRGTEITIPLQGIEKSWQSSGS